MKYINKVIWGTLGAIYFPIFLLGIIVAYLTRVILAICYILMLDFKQAKNIIVYTFKPFNYNGDYSKRF